MVHSQAIGNERHRRLGELLRTARESIPVDIVSLGNTLRFSNRVGKRVSQEELAEVVGVGRNWYLKLERGEPIQSSVGLLERLCGALMLDEHQRATVFELGVPESVSSALESRCGPLLKACARIRSGGKRLWSASTVDEALEIAAEETSRHFGDAGLVLFVQRTSEGKWKHAFVVDRGISAQNADMFAEFASSLTGSAFDEIHLYPLLSEPGDVGSRDTHRATSVGRIYDEGLVKHRLTRSTFLHARIRSRGGITGGLTVKHARERDYSEADRAVIGAVASLASLALS